MHGRKNVEIIFTFNPVNNAFSATCICYFGVPEFGLTTCA